ncbi:hypothetical protein Patl1_24853 [Pistacia atlantica]|uniref:Uncharacterized protein n=1 Tax=Pistacia atlantica TaxID=434234 RepID=A0ACC1B4L2_9ROSI|nr:hypothetical protein Patl1_24853 [Pistacia atlantica]
MLVLACLDADANRLSLDEKNKMTTESRVALSETEGYCNPKGRGPGGKELTSKKDTATSDDDDKNKGHGSYGNPSGSGDESHHCFEFDKPPKHN